MNSQEGMTIAKMAIVAMLLSLVIGAIFTTWYLSSTPITEAERSMQKAALSAAAERMYEFQDMSNTARSSLVYEDYPLVTNVCNALTEFNEDNLLFIYCVQNKRTLAGNVEYSNVNYYTYENVDIHIPTTFPGYNKLVSSSRHQDTIPLTSAVKLLLPYSKYRCNVQIVNYNSTGEPTEGSSNPESNPLMGIIVEVLVKEV